MISGEFPSEIFTGLLARHLETFRELERLQVSALQGVKSRGLEGLTEMLSRQREIMEAIAREKSELRPYLDHWEKLDSETRGLLRQGRPGEILDALEVVAKGIQSRHQDMFGGDDAAAGDAGAGRAPGNGEAGPAGANSAPPDLSQVINIYRSMQ